MLQEHPEIAVSPLAGGPQGALNGSAAIGSPEAPHSAVRPPQGQGDGIVDAPRRRPGRPRGSGHRIKANAEQRELLISEGTALNQMRRVADGKPIRLGRGKTKVWVVPTLDQVIHASEILLRKQLPDLKATELTGAGGGPVQVEEPSRLELGRRVAYCLVSGGADPKPDPLVLSPGAPAAYMNRAIDVSPPREPAAPPGPKLLPGEHLEADGSIRFIHVETGETRWRLP